MLHIFSLILAAYLYVMFRHNILLVSVYVACFTTVTLDPKTFWDKYISEPKVESKNHQNINKCSWKYKNPNVNWNKYEYTTYYKLLHIIFNISYRQFKIIIIIIYVKWQNYF